MKLSKVNEDKKEPEMLLTFRKFFLGVLCTSLLVGCNDRATSEKRLILGTSSDNPPYEFFSSMENKVTGFDIELAELIAKELGQTLEVKDMDFNALIPAVSSGRIDVAMASITPTNERKKSVTFSDIYYQAQAAMMTRKDSRIGSTKDFKGKRVGVQMGSSHEAFMKDVLKKSKNFKLVSRNKTTELVQELKNNRIDVAVMEARPATEFAKADDSIQSKLMESSVVSFAIAMKKGAPAVHRINKAIKSLHEKGEIKRLEKKWLK